MRTLTRLLALLALAGCTDAGCAKVGALGNPSKITCWSGDTVIYKGESTGKVMNETNSDGYYFRDAASGRLMEVSGNCVLEMQP